MALHYFSTKHSVLPTTESSISAPVHPVVMGTWHQPGKIMMTCYIRGVGTGPATARQKFPEPTIKNIIPIFVIKQLETFMLQLNGYAILIKGLYYYIERTS